MKQLKILTIQDIQKYRDTFAKFTKEVIKGKFINPVHMVNNGYLHTLNASFDGLFLREQKSDSLLVANHPMNFGTIQPCIRTEDKQAEKKSLLHLGIFNICGYSILGFENMSIEEMAKRTIDDFFIFYTQYLHLDPKLLRIYIFGGGTLREITDGVIKNDEYVEPDNFSIKLWEKYGVIKDQFIQEHSKETFLLHLANPLREHHAGYRNDIFMQVGEKSYEVATLNFISHQTVIKNNEITGIKLLPFYLREMAVGQERILTAIKDSQNVYELPYVKPLLNAVEELIMDKKKALIYTDALRVVQYFFADGWTYDKLHGQKYREHRHELNKFMEILMDYGKDIADSQLTTFLKRNARLQPWNPILEDGIEVTIKQLNLFKKKKR